MRARVTLGAIARNGLRRLSGNGAHARPGSAQAVADDMIRRAGTAAAARRWQEAGFLYAEAIRLSPGRAHLHVQCGHMFKEAGDLASAEPHYMTAAALTPDDPDLALQLGHFFKCAGRLEKAREAYQNALELRPGWSPARQELQALYQAGWRAPGERVRGDEDIGSDGNAIAAIGRGTSIVAELAPRALIEGYRAHNEGVELRRLGRRERTHWGVMPVLRGVEAIRGVCICSKPVLLVEIILNDRMIYRGGLKGGFELPRESRNPDLRKYVFNIWIDLSQFVEGCYQFECRISDVDLQTRSHIERIVIAAPWGPSILPDSDGIVAPPDPDDPRSTEDQINARPSMVRPGRRAMLQTSPRTVLVQRADQLGDLVVSIPALRRLRELLPEARLIGLISKANVDLAQTLGLFDEFIAIDFPEDRWEQRRVMPIKAQQELAAQLKPYSFDMAIDLSENPTARLLLPLSGAPFLVGFSSDGMPGLSIDLTGNTHDRWNFHEMVPHTNKQLGLVEWMGALLRSEPNLVRRADLDPGRLAAFGPLPEARFALLHDGARLPFSRWPFYPDLAQLIIERTDLQVVMLTDDPGLDERLPETLSRSPRFRLIERRLAFDDFDALVSYCAVFVGNDSGPKHLASLRGAKVVSLHMARNNWNEWGQENGGYIISRKLPCAGCLIHYEPEDCGKDHVCIRGIRPDEVFAAVERLIQPAEEPATAALA
jgi:ADP-heptose:LPS heptosyltransferase